jgi:cell division protein ZapA
MADKASLVHVEIFGQTYAVRGADSAHVEKLAGYVDAEMRAVSRTGGTVDSMRVAVLAALNLADETFRLKEELRRAETLVRQRVEKLGRELTSVLGE